MATPNTAPVPSRAKSEMPDAPSIVDSIRVTLQGAKSVRPRDILGSREGRAEFERLMGVDLQIADNGSSVR